MKKSKNKKSLRKLSKRTKVKFGSFIDALDKFSDSTKKVLRKSSKLTEAPTKIMKVKTGSIKDFFAGTREIMRAADKGIPIKERCATLTFIDPKEMLHFLSAAKIKLINSIRRHPDSITNLAKALNRTLSAVRRDVHEMESVGIVKTHEEINPAGHGRHKIVELVASKLKLEAFI